MQESGIAHSGGDSVAIGMYSPSSPYLHTFTPPSTPLLPVPNKLYGFCGH